MLQDGTVKLTESGLGRSWVGRVTARDEDAARPDLPHHRLNSWRNVALGIVTTLLIAVAAAAFAFVQRETMFYDEGQQLLATQHEPVGEEAGK